MKSYAMLAGFGMAAALAACATTEDSMADEPRERGPQGECDASPAQGLVGSTASPEVGQRLLELTGAKILRWAPPRSAMTMDFRPDRLTVTYDDDMVITRISCG